MAGPVEITGVEAKLKHLCRHQREVKVAAGARVTGGQGQEQVDAVCQLRGYGTNQAQIRRRDSAEEFLANPGQRVQLLAPVV